jgi:hypothetical protein
MSATAKVITTAAAMAFCYGFAGYYIYRAHSLKIPGAWRPDLGLLDLFLLTVFFGAGCIYLVLPANWSLGNKLVSAISIAFLVAVATAWIYCTIAFNQFGT